MRFEQSLGPFTPVLPSPENAPNFLAFRTTHGRPDEALAERLSLVYSGPMFVIRPTKSLGKKMGQKLADTSLTSTTRLGDWYSTDLVLNRRQFVLSVSDKTRIAVLTKAAPYSTFPKRLPSAISEVLLALGISAENVASEMKEMNEIHLAKTESRSIIGSMVDYNKHLQFAAEARRFNLEDRVTVSLWLSAVPSLVMQEVFPDKATFTAFEQPPVERRQKMFSTALNQPLYHVK
jgi:hypothetical protein